MEKSFAPQDVEARLYRWWERHGYFKPRPVTSDSPPFVISMPPPNVTGELHLGHALTATMEDIMIRWHRMRGDSTLWVPGTDHAGIATQVVVERMLKKEGTNKAAIGRDKFIERTWDWKNTYGSRITEQLRRLGASCDWDHERFTFDDGLSAAVREVFVKLHEDGLIYRDGRIINWCPRCLTAISDIEVDHKDKPGKLYQVAYKIQGSDEVITVATTRPETIPGDTAIAVHPDDEKLVHLIGQHAVVPVIGRIIPIIADSALELGFGTGALKVTPAHDSVDFGIGVRHNLDRIQVIGFDGKMTAESGPYAGLDRVEARDKILADIEAAGQLVQAEDYTVPVATCERCGTVVEPLVSQQWFVSMKPLATPALAAVHYGQTKIVPERFTKTYIDWLTNIHDWCISRQLWWGHRIPAWYCANGHTTVSRESPVACSTCGNDQLEQDPDVLDTWFSSWLWPFSTLGWPEKTADLSAYYPTTVMETGYDIIFFWVARMMMAGLYFTGAVPFSTIYLHGLIRDAKGEKMSKSKGNGIDPLAMIDLYGADALRFTLATISTPGNDSKLSEQRIEGNRNFTTKIWNASRFVLTTLETAGSVNLSESPSSLADHWITSRLHALIGNCTILLEDFQFGEAGRQIYDYFWGDFCDWYLEIAKIQLRIAGENDDPAARTATLATLVRVLNGALHLLHPYMPYITEEIYQQLPDHKEALIIQPWPMEGRRDISSEHNMTHVMELVSAIRTTRSELSIDPKERLTAIVVAGKHLQLLEGQRAIIESLAGLNILTLRKASGAIPPQSLHLAFPDMEAYLPLEGVVDMAEERSRTEEEIDRVEKSIAGLWGRLRNSDFTDKAPPAVIQKERTRLSENEELLGRLQSRLQTLST